MYRIYCYILLRIQEIYLKYLLSSQYYIVIITSSRSLFCKYYYSVSNILPGINSAISEGFPVRSKVQFYSISARILTRTSLYILRTLYNLKETTRYSNLFKKISQNKSMLPFKRILRIFINLFNFQFHKKFQQ